MFCPNCGNKTSTEQKFCRSCGLALEKIALSLGEQLPERLDQSLVARQERLQKLGLGALGVFAVCILSFLLYAVGQKLLTSQGSLLTILAMVGLVIMLGCGLLSVILFARAEELKEQANKRQLQANANELAGSTKELLPEGRFEPVPTVTERTTELLFREQRQTKKPQNEMSSRQSGDFA
jgi:zinc ribbon protein